MNTLSLFQAYPLTDALTLKNRIVMAPMTRAKADENFVPTADMAAYYARRADVGLIITEGTIISAEARGHHHVPGIFSNAQVAGWKQVTDAVHARGGVIFCQLWHVGRVSHPSFLDGKLPLSPSATLMTGPVSRSSGLTHGQSRAATTDELSGVISDFTTAAMNAIQAGFDGVELHGANGYLLDQFLHYHTNQRTDDYGGSPETMCRFVLDVIRACKNQIGGHRVALRLSPGAYLNEMQGDPRDAAVFQYLLTQLNHEGIAYVHTGNFNDARQFDELNGLTMTAFMRQFYHGTLIASGGYEIEQAVEAMKQNRFDLIAMGRPLIANPDLVHKLRQNEPLCPYEVSMLSSL